MGNRTAPDISRFLTIIFMVDGHRSGLSSFQFNGSIRQFTFCETSVPTIVRAFDVPIAFYRPKPRNFRSDIRAEYRAEFFSCACRNSQFA
jgi:hypothetical protein